MINDNMLKLQIIPSMIDEWERNEIDDETQKPIPFSYDFYTNVKILD